MSQEVKAQVWISIVVGCITVVGAFGSVSLAIGNRDTRLATVELHVERNDVLLEKIEARLYGIDARLSRIEGRLGGR